MNDAVSPTLVAQIAIAQLASFASLLLAASGVHKLAARARAARAVQDLTGLDAGASARAAVVLAAAELLAAAGLWVPAARFDAALLATAVWIGYFVFLVQALAAGRREIDCGCSFGAAHRPLGLFQVVRAASLALLGLVVAFSAAVAPGALAYDVSPAAVATQLLAGMALVALYGALDELAALPAPRSGVRA